MFWRRCGGTKDRRSLPSVVSEGKRATRSRGPSEWRAFVDGCSSAVNERPGTHSHARLLSPAVTATAAPERLCCAGDNCHSFRVAVFLERHLPTGQARRPKGRRRLYRRVLCGLRMWLSGRLCWCQRMCPYNTVSKTRSKTSVDETTGHHTAHRVRPRTRTRYRTYTPPC